MAKRKRAPGGGMKPKGKFSGLTSVLSLRMPADMRKELEKAAKAKDCSLSQELLHRVQTSFSEDRKRARDPALQAMCFLIGEVAEGITNPVMRVAGATLPRWRSNPFLFRAFKLAVGQLLDALEPAGEIKGPSGEALKPIEGVTLHARSDFLRPLHQSPEKLASFVSAGILRVFLGNADGHSNARWGGDYGIESARRYLNVIPKREEAMKGHIRRRGENSFELKFDAGIDPRTGKRITKYASFKGSKRDAQAKLAELITAVAKGSHVDVSKVAIAEFVRSRIDQWEASGSISARTAGRYRELNENQIVPHIGAMVLQKLRPLHIEEWHVTLRVKGRADGKGGLAPRTIGHAHRVLSSALNDAAENDLILRNVMQSKSPPKVPDDEMIIVRDVPAFIAEVKASGRSLYVPAMISLFTGMRRSEVLALRWGRMALDKGVIQVREALEFTKAHGIRFKPPKSKAGRRDITLPAILIDVLREYRKTQLELRLRLATWQSCTTMICCSLNSTLGRYPLMRSARRGAITPRPSACRR